MPRSRTDEERPAARGDAAGTRRGRLPPRRTVPILLIGGVALVALAIAVVGSAGGEGQEGRGGSLAWEGRPRLVKPATLPRDRVVSGRVRNTSLQRVRIEARDVRLETADGARVQGTATFVGTFLHGLYPPTREPQNMAESELRRTGRLAVIEPRTSVPVTLAWRLGEGEPPPERVDFGAGTLPLPR